MHSAPTRQVCSVQMRSVPTRKACSVQMQSAPKRHGDQRSAVVVVVVVVVVFGSVRMVNPIWVSPEQHSRIKDPTNSDLEADPTRDLSTPHPFYTRSSKCSVILLA
eukprot:5855015-Pyramimonas_sp.AAC.1